MSAITWFLFVFSLLLCDWGGGLEFSHLNQDLGVLDADLGKSLVHVVKQLLANEHEL